MKHSFTVEAIKERVANIAKRAERESRIRIVGRATVVIDLPRNRIRKNYA